MDTTNRRGNRLLIAAALLTQISFTQIPKDKAYHFSAGVISEYAGEKFDIKVPLASSFVIGFGKELYDYVDYGKFDTKDLAATVLGGIAYTVTIKLINNDKKVNNRIVRSYRKHKRKQSRKKRK